MYEDHEDHEDYSDWISDFQDEYDCYQEEYDKRCSYKDNDVVPTQDLVEVTVDVLAEDTKKKYKDLFGDCMVARAFTRKFPDKVVSVGLCTFNLDGFSGIMPEWVGENVRKWCKLSGEEVKPFSFTVKVPRKFVEV